MTLEFTKDFFTENVPHWERDLAELRGAPDVRALELGCFEGRATCWLLQNVLTGNDAEIECVDTFGWEDQAGGEHDMAAVRERFLGNVAEARGETSVRLYQQRSGDFLRSAIGLYDFIYIDASHVAANVLEDSILSWRHLKIGGVLTWDDYGWTVAPDPLDRPAPAIDAFLSIMTGRFDLLRKDWQVTVRRTR